MIQLRRLQKGRRWKAERGKKVNGAWRGGSKVESEVVSYPDLRVTEILVVAWLGRVRSGYEIKCMVRKPG